MRPGKSEKKGVKYFGLEIQFLEYVYLEVVMGI